MTVPEADRPVGLYDSGVGGLSVWQAVRTALPAERLIYVADTAHVPYGDKSRHTIIDRALALADYFRHRHVKALVVPCNTATAAAIAVLRDRHPDLPIVGIEPAVKPAARLSRSGHIGVLATTGTLSSLRFRQLIEREAGSARVMLQPCPEWVAAVEAGHVADAHALQVVQRALAPVLAAGADVLVLGCTHFPFLITPIRQCVGNTMPVLETGTAVARQLQRLLADRGILRQGGDAGLGEFLASGDPQQLACVGARLLSAMQPPTEATTASTAGRTAEVMTLPALALPAHWC